MIYGVILQFNQLTINYITVFLWIIKNKVTNLFQKFQALIGRHNNTKVLYTYTDCRGEYKSLDPYLKSQGIEHLVSLPYTPQRFSLAECRHRNIIETARTLLHEASLSSALWSFACQHATYLINHFPTPQLQNKSVFQLLFGQEPDNNS